MSCGQGKYIELRMRKKILQERANKKNEELGYYNEDYYDNWTPEDEEKKRQEYLEKQKQKKEELESKLETEKMITGPINIGLKNSHKIQSVNKEQLSSVINNNNEEVKKILIKMDKEVNTAMHSKVYKDHIKEFFDPQIYNQKEAEMKGNYKFDDEMNKYCHNINLDHHLMKNPLKKYTEAYLKYKNTMRTFSKNKK